MIRKRETNKKFDKKRQEIVELARKYLDNRGTIDMTTFRKEQSSAYSRLAYYFNGVNGLLEALAPFNREQLDLTFDEHDEEKNDDENHEVKRATGRGCPVNAQSVRNELAYDMLNLMRKTMTFQEIGELYGVSRAHIHQLENMLEKNILSKERKVTLELLT